MQILALALVLFVIVLHIYFLVLEMFLWDKPYGRKVFGTKEQFAKDSKALAANQGLYNGFLAAGLIWGVMLGVGTEGFALTVFFLCCVVVAGVFGGLTVNKRIFFIQAIPATLGLLLVFFVPK
jgi:putative membrane protein